MTLEPADFNSHRMIPQEYSWGKLLISEDIMKRLLSHYNVFPAFLDVLNAFGERTTAAGDSLGGCYISRHESVSGT